MSDTVYSINGPVITVRNTKSFAMREMTYVGKKHLLGEVIKVNDDCTTIQVYESTTGLRPGEEVIGTGSLLNATLGPGLLKNIYDGIERPLQKIEEIEGAFISEGSQVDAIDTKVKWDVTMLIKEGDVVTAGEIFATCQETSVIEHRSMIPNGVHGVAKNVKPSGSYTVNHVLAVVEDEETGKQTEIARIHTVIKGVRGAQSSGAALVSFNASAFESYEKEQSYNAPVGKYAMFAYTTALNYLLTQSKYVKLLGDTTVVYWSEDADIECKDLFLAASEPTTDNQELLDGVFSNLEKGYAVDVDSVYKNINLNQRFYILGIAPNAARLSVRFFYTDEFGKILQHLKEHYDRMEVVRPAKDTIHYMGIWRMLQETVNKKSKDKSPQAGMAGRTFSAILSGGRYPESMYFAVLERIRAEQDDSDAHSYKITRGRAGIIKAYLIRNTKSLQGREGLFVALNEACNDVAYVLGREFSVLEDIQQTANPGINATIKDRYFNSACATPAVIFPVLYKLKNSHVRKLSVGNAIYFEKILTSLQAKLPAEGLPLRLTLEQQGKFILGYYHQTQKRYEKKGDD